MTDRQLRSALDKAVYWNDTMSIKQVFDLLNAPEDEPGGAECSPDPLAKYPADFVGPVGRHARSRVELEREIMSPSIAKNDREWWAMEEIEALRKVEAAANLLLDGSQPPSLANQAKLADALHNAWSRRQ